MKDELEKLVQEAVDEELGPVPAPQHAEVATRARQIATRRYVLVGTAMIFLLAGAALTGISFLDRSTPSPRESRVAAVPSENGSDEVAAFAIRAVGKANLISASGTFLDYEGIAPLEEEWLVGFRTLDCTNSARAGSCTDLSVPTELTVTLEDDRYHVESTVGIADPEGAERVRNYSEPKSPVPVGYEFVAVEIVRYENSAGLEGSPIWNGPIPSDLSTMTCHALVLDSGDRELFSGGLGSAPLQLEPPDVESARSGGIAAVRVPVTLLQKSDLRSTITCK